VARKDKLPKILCSLAHKNILFFQKIYFFCSKRSAEIIKMSYRGGLCPLSFYFVARPIFTQKFVARPIFRINIYFLKIEKMLARPKNHQKSVARPKNEKKRVLVTYMRPSCITLVVLTDFGYHRKC